MPNRSPFKSVRELGDAFFKHREELAQRCNIRGGCIFIDRYPIALSRCNTPEKVLGWVCHLAGKGASPAILEAFVKLACKENGIQIDYSLTSSGNV
jgi:hypothetical protein